MHSRGSCPLEHGRPYYLLNLTETKELVTPKGHRLCDHFDRNVSNNLLSRKLKYPKRYAKGPGGHRLVRVSQLCLPDLSPSAGSRNRQLSTLTASIGFSKPCPAPPPIRQGRSHSGPLPDQRPSDLANALQTNMQNIHHRC